MNLEQLIDYLSRDEEFNKRLSKWLVFDAQPARTVPFPEDLHPKLQEALQEKNISALYTHQLQAYRQARAGKNVVVVTPTASGKTLSYNLPVFEEILHNPESRAVYLFPTKALSQDQTRESEDLVKRLGVDIKTYTFDGDTPADVRRTIRRAGHIVITNPDMLHQGILPHHTLWIKLFENLKYVVLDEIHTYRGVFGSHVANLLRRLKRICHFYGSKPQFICSSATIANPKELAENLLEEDVVLVDENGAPRGKKHFLFYNPPVVNPELGLRRGVVSEVKQVVRKIMPTGAQMIVFARSRQRVEVLATYLRELAVQMKIPANKVRGYRGGYLPKERREIERGLKNGSIQVVVSTNALELGIDIGQLDVSIMAGYPGSVASTWQQAGRAGRRQSTSLTILVASSSPLDQYIMEHPYYFFRKNPETAQIDRENLAILMSHLKCAAFELPFTEDENFTKDITGQLLDFLVQENVLRKTDGKYFWMSEIYPADEVGLRNIASENVVIIDTTSNNRVIGEIDLFSAPEMVHKDAIYIHDSVQYHVDDLDWDEKKAYVHVVKSDHYTDAITKTDLKVLDILQEDSGEADDFKKYFGEVAVSRATTGFKKIKFHTHENIGLGKVYLPEIEMQTSAVWWEFNDALFVDPYFKESVIGEGLQGIAYTLHNLIPVYIMCDITDISVIPMVRAPFSGKPTIYVFDKYQGGIGLSKKLFAMDRAVFAAVRRHIKDCSCKHGCPSCTGPTLEGNLFGKQSALKILNQLNLEE
ncbi:MAG TPA: DEAD/DEAH box helicase [Caldithrix abyssi]|uniref:DEAD/DEAH box helicase n=1 Tax=Caldithrix abyssi TaxID=187145 RepID=A0A7V4TZK5_CALAY|nr:DEAD/DEAH box helicase [Caldithrix abyssi]